ncbi:MAG: twin-arginine translocase TatA/TatE family subunit [Solirubrobacterales bacterium]
MPNIGPLEIVVVLVLVLIIFGPKRLPELGRSLGKGIREFRGSITGHDDDDDEQPPRELNTGAGSTATPVAAEPEKQPESSTGP